MTFNLTGSGHQSIKMEYSKVGDQEGMIVYTDSSVRDQEPETKVEVMPKFQDGGLETFLNWVMSNVKYPKVAMENGVEGKVTVSFVIEKDGKLSTIEIVHSPDHLLAEEVINVLLRSPLWTPGKKADGEPARVKFTLPVAFKLS